VRSAGVKELSPTVGLSSGSPDAESVKAAVTDGLAEKYYTNHLTEVEQMVMKKISVETFEKHSGLKLLDCVGHCHTAAHALLKMLPSGWKVARGVWLGPIYQDSLFGRDQRPFTQHSWCQEVKTGAIIDPTRFAFYENEGPSITYVDPDQDQGLYDLGGCVVRRGLCNMPPPFPKKVRGSLVPLDLPLTLQEYLAVELKRKPPYGRWEYAYIVGGGMTYNPATHFIPLCNTLIKAGCAELIPLDIRQWCELEEEL
jgi:hypothetical protein